MPKTNHIPSQLSLIIFYSASVISLVISIIIFPPSFDPIPIFLILIALICLVELFPLDILFGKFSLVPVIVFPSALLYGIGDASTAATLGIAVVIILRTIFIPRSRMISSTQKFVIVNGSLQLGLILIALLVSTLVFGIEGGINEIALNWLNILGAGLAFGLLHGAMYLYLAKYPEEIKNNKARWDYLALISLEILPLFWGFITLLMVPTLGVYSIVVSGVSISILAVLLHYLSAPRKDLERRIQELSALDKVSRALRNEIDLEKLLATIEEQVTGLLNVDNFYVALFDSADRNIWYPLAVKNGLRQNWPRRPLTDRLTDRVILESKSILIPQNAQQELKNIGLPHGEDAPYAWIGVPLIASEETIGCLASFSLDSQVAFNEDDLYLLSILSGQTSVAIEIALHNALLASDITIGRDRLTTVLNSVKDGIILVENDARITLLNDAVHHLTGMPKSDFIGNKINDLSPSALASLGYSLEDLEHMRFDEYLLQQETNEKTSYSTVSFGKDKYLERMIIPVFSQSSNSAGWIILLRDISEEQRMKEAQELINETLVHDLRSPLSSTISALDVIQDSIADGDPAGVVEPSIQIAQRSSRRVLAMVESILEISKMETGKIELSVSDTLIDKLIDQSMAEFSTVALQDKITLTKMVPESIPTVSMDQDIIQRVLNNLVDNALKYSPKESQVAIAAQILDGNQLEIRVSDSGPGIPHEYQQKIFARFVQIPGQPSRRRGLGLGLTYCQFAIDAHEGNIWVEDRPGGGSVFVFTIPIAGPEESRPQSAQRFQQS